MVMIILLERAILSYASMRGITSSNTYVYAYRHVATSYAMMPNHVILSF